MEKISDEVLSQIRRDGVVPRSMGKSMAEELVECRRANGNPREVAVHDGRLSTSMGLNAVQKKMCSLAANHLYTAFTWEAHPAGETFWMKVHNYLQELGS